MRSQDQADLILKLTRVYKRQQHQGANHLVDDKDGQGLLHHSFPAGLVLSNSSSFNIPVRVREKYVRVLHAVDHLLEEVVLLEGGRGQSFHHVDSYGV